MREHPPLARRCVGLVLVLLAAAALAAGCGTGTPKKSSTQTSSIWKVGTAWKVTVREDANIASPNSQHQYYDQVFDFKVGAAPKSASGSWRVDVTLEGAQGPAANGYHLFYVTSGSAFTLKQVSVGQQPPQGAAYAPVLLGQAFPLQKTVTSTPKDAHIKAANGGTGSQGLPPPLPPANLH
jgi:hypothetical protein